MIAAAAMGGLAVVLVQMAKTQSQQSAKSKISLDLAQMKSEIQTYFSNPAHCNANFYRKSQGALTITQIKKCSSTSAAGSCGSVAGPTSQSVYTASSATPWTGPDRVRINSMTGSISSVTTPTAPAVVIASATVTVKFDTKELQIGNAQTIKSNEQITYNVPVLIDSVGTVSGCPKNMNSTVPY